MLDLSRSTSHDELGSTGARLAARAIDRAHAEGRDATVLLAAALSQLPVLRALTRSDIHGRPVHYFHMDEYVGLAPQAPQAFGTWLERNYFDLLPRDHQATFQRLSTSGEPGMVAAAYAALLPEGDFDLVLCGVGITGISRSTTRAVTSTTRRRCGISSWPRRRGDNRSTRVTLAL